MSESKGWHKPQDRDDGTFRDASVAERLCLIHSEISEALEAVRDKNPHVYYSHTTEEYGSCISDQPELQWPDYSVTLGKPDGLGVELADAVIRIGDLCEILGIDLEECIQIKTEYNKGRAYRHGGRTL